MQVAITQIRLYICTGKTFFTVYLFNEWQLFTSWFNCFFSFLVYIMWCTVMMHIQNWNDSPVTMLKWATIGPPLHSNEWVQLLLLSLLLLPLRVHACMHAGAHARRSQEHGVTHKYTSIFAKRRFTCIYTGINDCLCMYAASPEPLLLADT